jgi:hypothetical protein
MGHPRPVMLAPPRSEEIRPGWAEVIGSGRLQAAPSSIAVTRSLGLSQRTLIGALQLPQHKHDLRI